MDQITTIPDLDVNEELYNALLEIAQDRGVSVEEVASGFLKAEVVTPNSVTEL